MTADWKCNCCTHAFRATADDWRKAFGRCAPACPKCTTASQYTYPIGLAGKADKLEHMGFECEGGPLSGCKEWQEVRAALSAPASAPAGDVQCFEVTDSERGDFHAGQCAWSSIGVHLPVGTKLYLAPLPAAGHAGAVDDELKRLARELAMAESRYRYAHDHHGDGSMDAGRAWDVMRRAGLAMTSFLAKYLDTAMAERLPICAGCTTPGPCGFSETCLGSYKAESDYGWCLSWMDGVCHCSRTFATREGAEGYAAEHLHGAAVTIEPARPSVGNGPQRRRQNFATEPPS